MDRNPSINNCLKSITRKFQPIRTFNMWKPCTKQTCYWLAEGKQTLLCNDRVCLPIAINIRPAWYKVSTCWKSLYTGNYELHGISWKILRITFRWISSIAVSYWNKSLRNVCIPVTTIFYYHVKEVLKTTYIGFPWCSKEIGDESLDNVCIYRHHKILLWHPGSFWVLYI